MDTKYSLVAWMPRMAGNEYPKVVVIALAPPVAV
jgi:hypothetical protein